MTVDELTDLCDGLFEQLGILSPAAFRSGTELLDVLSDATFLLAVRFVSGERVPNGPAERPTIEPVPRRERQGVTLTPEKLAALAELDDEDDAEYELVAAVDDQVARQKDLGDGVFLGFAD